MVNEPRRTPKTRRGEKSRHKTSDQTLEILIDQLGSRGDGIGQHRGERVFVALSAPGDRVMVRLGPTSEKEGPRGSIVSVIHPSPLRQAAACPHFGACGGCTLQHLNAEVYEAWKREQVCEAVRRAGFSADLVGELVCVPAQTRRRARVAALRTKNQVILGFQERASHRLLDVGECPILDPELAGLLSALRAALGTALAQGETADIVLTATPAGVDVLLIGPTRLGLAEREALGAFAADADLARLNWAPVDKGEPEPVAVRRPVSIPCGQTHVPLPPGAFLQPTAAGEAALVAAVLDATKAAGRVADLYAGLGTFSFPLAARGATVHAVEGDDQAVRAIRQALTSDRRVTCERRDLARSPLTGPELNGFDAVVFDPPRAGAQAQAAALATADVPVVVAVSCNPATWCRDARLLREGGYELLRVRPIDQFLWSSHVELVSVFQKAP